MTFLKREMLKEKPDRAVVFGLVVAASVVPGGYVLFLAILAPEQLAEATTAATDLVCSGCVGTSDIADNAITSGKIANGQVKAADIATDAVTAVEIGANQVGTSEIADDSVTTEDIGSEQVTGSDISNTAGVTGLDIIDGRVSSLDIADGQINTVDIANSAVNTAKIADGQVTGNDIASQPFGVGTGDINNGAVNTEDIANDAIKPNVHRVVGSGTTLAPGGSGIATLDCPAGTILSGGGFGVAFGMQVLENYPLDGNTWRVSALNENPTNANFNAYALCIGPSP